MLFLSPLHMHTLLVFVFIQLAVMRQSSSLVSSDKDYLSRQVMELQRRIDAGEERTRQALQQADQQRTQREDIYERYVRARDEYKAMFEKVRSRSRATASLRFIIAFAFTAAVVRVH